jgi:hypothetical protein
VAGSVDPIFHHFREAISGHFDDLFANHGFTVVAEFNYHHGEYQALIAASADCLVKFKLEQNVFELSFARLDAPREWSDERGGALWWHSFLAVTGFADELHPGLAASLTPARQDFDQDGIIAAYATLLQPYLPRILIAFGPDRPEEWWTAYRAFRVREFKTSMLIA